VDAPAVTPVLEVTGLTRRFAGVAALDGVSLAVAPGECVGLIGPNGSGKTTLFNCVAGYVRPDGGRIRLAGTEITRWPPHTVARRGVGRTFQAARVFPRLTAREHCLAAMQEYQGDGFAARVLRLPAARAAEVAAGRRADELLEWVGLAAHAGAPAAELSYGQKKLLAFAMALMPEPRLLMLDEPMAGVSPALVERLAGHVRELHARGRTVLVIEHNLAVVMGLCQRLVVLDYGRVIAEGSPAAVRANPAVIEAYFGG
jgi:ABC-type branched-subunit amino acid transport system ATPase component